MKLALHAGQSLGRRARQEDSFAVVEGEDGSLLAAVADGLGGHPAGDLASRIAAEGISDYARREAAALRQSPPRALLRIAFGIDGAMQELYRRQPELQGMATTLAVLYFTPDRVFRLSIGDSLIFRADRGGRCQRWNVLHETEDGYLTSCLGSSFEEADCPARGASVKPGDRYLIASDGIEVLQPRQIRRMLRSAATPQEAVEEMLSAIDKIQFRHQDNTTLIAVFA